MKLLLQQQPVAGDLRQISSALKMISDMERIGDQAQDIADMSRFVQVKELAHKIHIGEMAEAAIKMVTGSIDSFVKKDLEAAAKVVEYDDVVDNLFLKVKQELPNMMKKDAQQAEYYIDLIMIAKYLERIGDHAENIAQWVESVSYTHLDVYKRQGCIGKTCCCFGRRYCCSGTFFRSSCNCLYLAGPGTKWRTYCCTENNLRRQL